MIKLQKLLCVMCALIAMPALASAEVYKWKEKQGTIRYSDTRPPSNIKLESIDGKRVFKAKPSNQAPLSPVVNTSASAVKDDMKVKVANPNGAIPNAEYTEETAAKLRQKNAEIEKNNKKDKEAQAKLNEENCKSAKSNLASYSQGGRIYKMNEKGEREYMDDAGLKAGAEKAQKEVTEYCKG